MLVMQSFMLKHLMKWQKCQRSMEWKWAEQGDQAHIEAMEKMKESMSDPEAMKEWYETVQKMFDSLEGSAKVPRRHSYNPTFPIWLNIPLSKSSAFFKPLSICETLAVGMAIITP